MREPLVVAVCDKRGGYQDELERRLKAEGVDYLCSLIPKFSWRLRALETLKIAKDNPNRHLVFVDAWDTLFLGTKAELTSWFKLHAHIDVMLAASKVCWPDQDRYVAYNVKQRGRGMSEWRYVNSNPMAGLGKNIAAAMEWAWDVDPIRGDSADTREPSGNVCERYYTTMYLDAPFTIDVDHTCSLNQIMLCSTPGDLLITTRRVVNLRTGRTPIFFHANGKVQLDLELFR